MVRDRFWNPAHLVCSQAHAWSMCGHHVTTLSLNVLLCKMNTAVPSSQWRGRYSARNRVRAPWVLLPLLFGPLLICGH